MTCDHTSTSTLASAPPAMVILIPPPSVSIPGFAPLVRAQNDDFIDWNGRAVQPLAPIIRNVDDDRIMWSPQSFGLPAPKDYENCEKMRALGTHLFRAAIGSAAATIWAGVAFTATPIVVQYTVLGLALTTITLSIASVIALKKDYWNDPAYRIEQGKLAEVDIRDHTLNLTELQNKYGYLRKYEILTAGHLNALFRKVIFDETLSFDETRIRLGFQDNEDASFGGFTLDTLNFQMFQKKQWLEIENTIRNNGRLFAEIERKHGILKSRGLLTVDDLNRLYRNQIFNDANSYETLRAMLKGKEGFFGFCLDESNKEMVIRKLMIHISQYGDQNITPQELNSLGISIESLVHSVVTLAYSDLESKKITYDQFIERIGIRLSVCQTRHEEIRGFALSAFKSSNAGLDTILRRADVQTLGITVDALLHYGILETDLKELSEEFSVYEKFRNRHSVLFQGKNPGSEPFYLLKKKDQLILKEAYLDSYRTMHSYSGDAQFYGISNLRRHMEARVKNSILHMSTFAEVLEEFGESVFTDKYLTKDSRGLKQLICLSLQSSYHLASDSIFKKHDLLSDDVLSVISKACDSEMTTSISYHNRKRTFELYHVTELARLKQEHEERYRFQIDALREDLEKAELALKAAQEQHNLTQAANRDRAFSELQNLYQQQRQEVEKLSKMPLTTALNLSIAEELAAYTNAKLDLVSKEEKLDGSRIQLENYLSKFNANLENKIQAAITSQVKQLAQLETDWQGELRVIQEKYTSELLSFIS